ncbi:MAG TPA: nucleotidyltransferase family protein [Burkholderiales bacterium]|nr:nucleotidyltransferase family protein [Burkholderiales bacterium]
MASLLTLALREPQALAHRSLADWELVIRQGRGTNLLARLAARLEERGLLDAVPAAPRAHLDAARIVCRAQEEAVRREVTILREALVRAGVEGILLKGAAYLYAGLPAARGRLYTDIDLLVPRESLGAVEAALMLQGWATTHHHPYDQRYYRRWMHELPPLQHATRLTVVDVHHAILPPTARPKPDSAKLWADSRALSSAPPLRVLAPADMVLHSATHLFFNEEFSHGLRDLSDLDILLRHFASQAGFWDRLGARSLELDLARPLYYALRYARALLGTPVPAAVLRAAEAAGPPSPLRTLMDGLFLRVLQTGLPAGQDRLAALARQALYLRAHWLRMPPLLLAYHLTHKALRPRELQPAPR